MLNAYEHGATARLSATKDARQRAGLDILRHFETIYIYSICI